MKSESSSSSGESGDVTTPPSQSPPRAQEKATTFAGNKPRPLRLVQDHPENRRASGEEGAGKRASWIGWASAAFSKKEETVGAEESIQE
jgi:hypothetical protein